MATERFTFTGHSGDELAARLDIPEGPVLATALFAHCFTCSKDIPAARRIASRLANMGIAVLRFDFTGLGHSSGEFANTTFSSNVEDLSLAAAELAKREKTVGVENATQIFTHAKHPKSFVTLCDADHLITREQDAEYAADVIAAWSSKYLDLRPPAPPIGAPEGVLRVREADPNGFLQDINLGHKFHLQADEPVAYGGTDKGMTPYGFLAAGLGACTTMTIRMYARRKKWPR